VLVFGAAEPRTGAIVSTVRGAELPGHNHRFEVVSDVRQDECRSMMQDFFREKRAR
jgi:tRNA(adenine34) deaminase